MKVRRSLPGKRCSRWKGFDCRVSEMDQGAMKLVPDLAKAFGVSLPVVWAWATHFIFTRKMLRVQRGYFEHQSREQRAGTDHHGHPPWVEVELFAPSHSVARCSKRTLKLEDFVDDIESFREGRKNL